MLVVQEDFEPAMDMVPQSNQVTDSQNAPNIASITVLSAPSEDYVFDVPDGLEQDPELIRAELLFMNTPQTEAYSENVYGTLKNIQSQCAIDYQKFCGPTATTTLFNVQDAQSIEDVMNFVMSPQFLMDPSMNLGRRLHGDSSYTAQSYLSYFRSFYLQNAAGSIMGPGPKGSKKSQEKKGKNGVKGAHDNVMKIQKAQDLADAELPKKEKKSVGFRRLRMDRMGNMADHHDNHIDHHGHDDDSRDNHNKDPKRNPRDQKKDPPKESPKDPRGSTPKDPPKDTRSNDPRSDPRNDPRNSPRGPPPPPPHDGYSDSDEEEDDHHGHGHGGPHGRRSHYWEDHSFAGALGYGASGDMCMYQHAAQLSPPCVNSVVDLYALRQQYWKNHVETTSPPHPHMGLFFLGGILLIALVKRCCMWKKRKAVRDLVAGLHADPELKATVEARLGITVPQLCCTKSSTGQGCMFKRCLCTFVFIVFTLMASMFISVTSLELTSAVVDKMDRDHEGDPTSPFFALFLLFVFITIQVSGLVFVIRRVKQWYAARSNNGNAAAACPSAPCADGKCPARPVATVVTSSPSYWHEWISPRIASISNFSVFGRRRNSAAYQPLLNQDDGTATEMISVGTAYDHSQHGAASQPRVAIYTGVPLNSHHMHATIVPVTATPVNSVNFV